MQGSSFIWGEHVDYTMVQMKSRSICHNYKPSRLIFPLYILFGVVFSVKGPWYHFTQDLLAVCNQSLGALKSPTLLLLLGCLIASR